MIGIYKIQNLVNGKVYIGSSCNLNKRLQEHKRTLRKNQHKNKHLQNSWNKHGEKNFSFSILIILKFKESLLPIEQTYFTLYSPEYNICQLAGNTLGRPMPKSAIDKLSKPYKFISPQKQIFIGLSIKAFCQEHNLHHSHMSAVLNNKLNHYKGWTSSLEKHYELLKNNRSTLRKYVSVCYT